MDEKWQTLKEDLSQVFNHFNHIVRQLHPSRREQTGVCGHWSPKEVAAHLAGWDHEAARRFHLFMKGPTKDINYDLDKFNSESVAVRQHMNWKQTLKELDKAHNILKIAIGQVEPKHLKMNDRFFRWLEGRIRDYKEHAKQIQAWI